MRAEVKRLYYIDWLRVLAFGLLFLFHTTRFFDSYPWHIKNSESSIVVNYFVEFTHSWRMHIIFLISGMGTFFAMRSKKSEFIKGRVSRLTVPYLFGIVILIPPQKYLEAIFQSAYNSSFWRFLVNYPTRLFSEGIGVNLSWTGHVGHHLWYLAFLFIQTVLFLPFLKHIAKSERIKSNLFQITSVFHRLWMLLIPFIAFEFVLRPAFPEYLNWADFAIYSLFFLYGFMFASNDTIVPVIEKNAYVLLLFGIICWSIYLLNKKTLDDLSQPEYSLGYLFTLILKNINSFSWVMAFLGLAKKFLNFNHRLLNDLNQGVLPFYILHQTVILFFGFFIIQWHLSIGEKFLIILITSFIVTLSLYQIVRRINGLRVIFGMTRKEVKAVKIM